MIFELFLYPDGQKRMQKITLSFGSTKKYYVCEKKDTKVELTLSLIDSNCRLIIMEPGKGSTTPYEDVDTCTSALGKKMVDYMDEGYICRSTGADYKKEG